MTVRRTEIVFFECPAEEPAQLGLRRLENSSEILLDTETENYASWTTQEQKFHYYFFTPKLQLKEYSSQRLAKHPLFIGA